MSAIGVQALKDLYKGQYTICSINKNVKLNIGEFFVDLQTVEVDKDSNIETSRRKSDAFIRRDDIEGRRSYAGRLVTLKEIVNRNYKKILILGSPGTGKSTLCRKILYEFYNNGLWENHFDDIVFLQLRNLNNVVIRETEKDFDCSDKELLYYRGRIFRQRNVFGRDIDKMLENSKNILYILDGLDEIQDLLMKNRILKELVNNIIDNESTIVATRSYVSLNISEFDSVIEVKGFNAFHVRKYMRKILRQTKPNNYTEEEEKIVRYIQQSSVSDLVTIPILLDIFLYTWEGIELTSPEVPLITMTSLYLRLVLKLWLKFIHSEGIDATDIDHSDFNACIQKVSPQNKILCGMANKWAKDGSLDFTLEESKGFLQELDEKSKDSILKVPFLHRINPKEQIAERRIYEFCHLTLVEFFFAFHLLHSDMGESEFGEFVRVHKHQSKFSVVFIFLGGLISEGIFSKVRSPECLNDKRKKLERYFNDLESEPTDFNGKYHYEFLVDCFQEVRHKNFIALREENLCKDIFDFFNRNNSKNGFLCKFPRIPLKLLEMFLDRKICPSLITYEYPALTDDLVDKVDIAIDDLDTKIEIYCAQPFYSRHTIKKLKILLTKESLLHLNPDLVSKPHYYTVCWLEMYRSLLSDEEKERLDSSQFLSLANGRMLSLQETTDLCRHLFIGPLPNSANLILQNLIWMESCEVKLLLFLKSSFDFMDEFPKAIQTIIKDENNILSANLVGRITALIIFLEICPGQEIVSWLIKKQIDFPKLKTIIWLVLCYPPFEIELSAEQLITFADFMKVERRICNDEYRLFLHHFVFLRCSNEIWDSPEKKAVASSSLQVNYASDTFYLSYYVYILLRHKQLSSFLVELAGKLLHDKLGSTSESQNMLDLIQVQICQDFPIQHVDNNLALNSIRIDLVLGRIAEKHKPIYKAEIRLIKSSAANSNKLLYDSNRLHNKLLLDEFERALQFWSKENSVYLISACKKYVQCDGQEGKTDLFRIKNVSLEYVEEVYNTRVQHFRRDITENQLGILLAMELVAAESVWAELQSDCEKEEFCRNVFGDLCKGDFCKSLIFLNNVIQSCIFYKVDTSDRVEWWRDGHLDSFHFLYTISLLTPKISNVVPNLSSKNFDPLLLLVMRLYEQLLQYPFYVSEDDGRLNCGGYVSQVLSHLQVLIIEGVFGGRNVDRYCRLIRNHVTNVHDSNYLTKWCEKVISVDNFERVIAEDTKNRAGIQQMLESNDYFIKISALNEKIEYFPRFEKKLRHYFNNYVRKDINNFVWLLSSPFHLNVSRAKLTDADIERLRLFLLRNQSQVHTLILSENELTNVGFFSALGIVGVASVRHLLLDKNFIYLDKKATISPALVLRRKISSLETLDLSFNFVSKDWLKELREIAGVFECSSEDSRGTVTVEYLRIKEKFNLIHRRNLPSAQFLPTICKFREYNLEAEVDFISERRGFVAWAEAKRFHCYSSHVLLIIERIRDGQRELSRADLVKDPRGECKVRWSTVDPFQRANRNGRQIQSFKTILNTKYGLPKRGYVLKEDGDDPMGELIGRIILSRDQTGLRTYSINTKVGGVYVNCVHWANDMLKSVVQGGNDILEVTLPSSFRIFLFLMRWADTIVLLFITFAMIVLANFIYNFLLE